MVDPINLRQFRRRRKREETSREAEANRKFHGLPVSLKKTAKANNKTVASRLDGKKINPEKEENASQTFSEHSRTSHKPVSGK